MPLRDDVTRHLEHAATARRLAGESESQAQALAFLELADLWAAKARHLASLAAQEPPNLGHTSAPPAKGGPAPPLRRR